MPSLCKHSSDSLWANGFRFYFTGITSLLFTFPSRYWCTIGEIKYLALAGSPACFPPSYLDLMVLKKNIKEHKVVFKYGTITLYGIPFQGISFNQTLICISLRKFRFYLFVMNRWKRNPRRYSLTTPVINNRFGLFPFRSPLLRE